MRTVTIDSIDKSKSRRPKEQKFVALIVAEIDGYRVIARSYQHPLPEKLISNIECRWTFHVERQGWNILGEEVYVESTHAGDNQYVFLKIALLSAGAIPSDENNWVSFDRLPDIPYRIIGDS